MHMLSLHILIASWATTVVAYGNSACYYVNGTKNNNDEVKQCSDGVTTMCCSLNRPNIPGNESTETGWAYDECLSNGLCQNRIKIDGQPYVSFWLEFCTNKDIGSSDCLDVCRNTRDQKGNTQMTPCGVRNDGLYNALEDDRETTRWCCGTSDACCTNNVDVIELPRNFTGKAIISSTSTSSSSTSTPTTSSETKSSGTASASGTPSPSANPSTETKEPEAKNDGGLSTGAKAGIGIGAAVAVIAILLAAFFGRKAYAYRKMVKDREGVDAYGFPGEKRGQDVYAHVGSPPSELNGFSNPIEMSQAHQLSELPSERYERNF